MRVYCKRCGRRMARTGRWHHRWGVGIVLVYGCRGCLAQRRRLVRGWTPRLRQMVRPRRYAVALALTATRARRAA